MKFIRTALFFIAIALLLPLSGGFAQKSPDLLRALPKDTLACFYIHNLKTFNARWKAHPLYSYAKDLIGEDAGPGAGEKAVRSGSDKTRKALKKSYAAAFEQEMGVSLEKIPEIFPGQWVVACVGSDIEKYIERKRTKKDELPIVFLMEHDGEPDTIDTIVSMIRSSAEYDAEKEGAKHRIVTEKYLGASLYVEEVEKDGNVRNAGGYAISGPVLVMSTKISRLRETVARLNKSDGPSIYDSKRFSDAMDRVGKDDVYFYADFTRPVEWIHKAAAEAKEKRAGNHNARKKPRLFSPELVLNALHLESFAAGFMGIDLSNTVSRVARVDSGIFLNDRKGIASLIQYGKGPLKLPDYIPENVVSARVTLFDLPGLLTRLEALVNDAAPMVGGLYNGYLAQLKAQAGVDIRESLLKNIGKGLSLVNFATDGPAGVRGPDPGSGQSPVSEVVCISISDRQGFTTALEGIKTMIGGPDRFKKQTYLDHDIYTLKNPEPASGKTKGISYSICDNMIFLSYGGMDGLKKVLARVNRPGKTLWETGSVKKAMKILPSGKVGISYVDIDQVIHSVSSMANFAEKRLKRNKKDLFDFQKINQSSLPFCLISATYSEKEGLFSRAILLKKDN